MAGFRIKRDDLVEVISGDDKGLRGQVRRVLPREGRVLVAGINIVKRHTRPTGPTQTQAGIIEREAPLDISNVALVCPHCDEPTRVGYRWDDEGRKVRFCKRCQEAME
jgi:large subunit ribosomal protein L24